MKTKKYESKLRNQKLSFEKKQNARSNPIFSSLNLKDHQENVGDDKMYALFDDLLKKYEVKFDEGDRVIGTIVSMDKKFVYVEMGLKDYALLPREEVSLAGERAEDILPIGQSREFVVMRKSAKEVRPFVSLKALEMEAAWERARQQLDTGEVLQALVLEGTKGGYKVDIDGFKSFLPISQIHPQHLIDELSGKTIPVRMIDLDVSKNRCVCSNRKALSNDNNAASILETLSVGDVVSGHIQNVTAFGAFVDFDGVAGLLHVSQISNDRIDDTEGIFQIGEPIKCMVLAIDNKKGRLSLTTKKLEPSPGDMLRNRGLVMEKAETLAALFRERVSAAEAAVNASEELKPKHK
jgi:small subunit ribosomal protein S1